jgi:CRP-like cAMP-binding protein
MVVPVIVPHTPIRAGFVAKYPYAELVADVTSGRVKIRTRRDVVDWLGCSTAVASRLLRRLREDRVVRARRSP